MLVSSVVGGSPNFTFTSVTDRDLQMLTIDRYTSPAVAPGGLRPAIIFFPGLPANALLFLVALLLLLVRHLFLVAMHLFLVAMHLFLVALLLLLVRHLFLVAMHLFLVALLLLLVRRLFLVAMHLFCSNGSRKVKIALQELTGETRSHTEAVQQSAQRQQSAKHKNLAMWHPSVTAPVVI